MKQFQRFGLDTANQCLLHNGAPVDLAPKPFAVLRYMVENPGRLITHDELLDALWPETFVQPQVLRTYMLELRKVLGDDAQNPRFIQTLPKRGYRFVAAVTEPAGAPGSPATNPSRDSEAHAKSGALEIVGRDAELESLQMMLRLATLGQRQMALVSGDPGIGKTALVDAFCQSDPSLAAKIARGQCVQGLGVSQEYYPVTEALSQLCAGPQGETAKRVIARLAPAWLGRGGSAESVAGGSAPAGSNERTLGDLFAALEEISVATTLILVFEDVHWAD
jgi:DNA-binding winged helix-turn-helix (wHTH) protein